MTQATKMVDVNAVFIREEKKLNTHETFTGI